MFIKIDVEGFEKEVIEGTQQIFSQTPNIIVVIELLSEINGHDNCVAISKSLMEHHFGHMFRIGRDHIIKKVDGFDEGSDYIFIKGEDALARFES